MVKHYKILIVIFLTTILVFFVGCSNSNMIKNGEQIDFSKNDSGYPRGDIVVINGEEYHMPDGVSANLQTFCFKISKENDVIISFKWSNINDIEKSFNDKEEYYLLKIKIFH